MELLNIADIELSLKIVEEIVENKVLDIERFLINITSQFDGNKKRQFLSHLSTLFGNVMVNQMTWRHESAYDKANKARLVIKEIHEDSRKAPLEDVKPKICDICGEDFSGFSYNVVDENYNVQQGLIQCERCKDINLNDNLGFSDKALEKRIDFLKVEIKCDKKKAEARYKEEYEQNFEGMKDGQISFNQWLAEREMEALHYTASLY